MLLVISRRVCINLQVNRGPQSTATTPWISTSWSSMSTRSQAVDRKRSKTRIRRVVSCLVSTRHCSNLAFTSNAPVCCTVATSISRLGVSPTVGRGSSALSCARSWSTNSNSKGQRPAKVMRASCNCFWPATTLDCKSRSVTLWRTLANVGELICRMYDTLIGAQSHLESVMLAIINKTDNVKQKSFTSPVSWVFDTAARSVSCIYWIFYR